MEPENAPTTAGTTTAVPQGALPHEDNKENSPPFADACTPTRPGLLSLWRRRGRRHVPSGFSPHIPAIVAEDGEADHVGDEAEVMVQAEVSEERDEAEVVAEALEHKLTTALSEAARRIGADFAVSASVIGSGAGAGAGAAATDINLRRPCHALASPPALASPVARPPRAPRPSLGNCWCRSPSAEPLGLSSCAATRTPCNTPEPFRPALDVCSPEEEKLQLQLREELEEQWRSPRRGHGLHKAHGGLRKHILQLHATSLMRDAGAASAKALSPGPSTRIT